MSDNYLQLIPSEPTFVPSLCAQQQAQKLFSSFVPESNEVRTEVFDGVQFVDAGANFESVACPTCGQQVTLKWWHNAMDAAYQNNFQNLLSILPCCGVQCSLNELNYSSAQGFSRFVLEAMNPNIADLEAEAIEKLEQVLGCSLRTVWAHY